VSETLQDRLFRIGRAIRRLDGEVCRSPENYAVQDILELIHTELVHLRQRIITLESKQEADNFRPKM
jgi:hypothetical protein